MSDRRSSRRDAESGSDANNKKGNPAAAASPSSAAAADLETSDHAPAGGSASPVLAPTASPGAPGAASSSSATSGIGTQAVGSKRGKQSIRASDQKRKKLIPRCTSPSHFLMEGSASGAAAGAGANGAAAAASVLSVATPLPSALSSDPNAPASSKLSESNARVDAFLHSIGAMYYRNTLTLGKDTNGPAEVWVSSDYDKLEYPTLDLLLSPLRKPNVIDNWTPREIALFESGICAVGKDFHAIAGLITTKSCRECVDFYYVWKKSSHYAMWKTYGKPSKKPHANKEEQWKAVRDTIQGKQPAQQAAAAKKDVQ